ncbi:ficolin-2-like [Littorina saxatilis]|uniref:Fibrinogen C-terminal domain-containing protein n=1 Tax=Littorina saxatilis TaxID=31220 RepID=A0AAN9GHP3_9CAEN
MKVSLTFCLLCVTYVVTSFNVQVNVDVDLAGRRHGIRGRGRPRNCVEAKRFSTRSGAVTIYPGNRNSPIRVYCDQETDGGGWLVFQRRRDGSVNFYRNWASYQTGFGDVSGEFWLGLDNLYKVTSGQRNVLRVDLMKWDGTKGNATYSNFAISDSSDNYRLNYTAFTGGNARDSLTGWHRGKEFSTYDQDHDSYSGNCAQMRHGAWWYKNCDMSNLNGGYKNSSYAPRSDGVIWDSFGGSSYSSKFSEMKTRPM